MSNLFDVLPHELLRFLLGDFCDGKSISTFLLAASSSHEYRRRCFDTVLGALECKLGSLDRQQAPVENIPEIDLDAVLQEESNSTRTLVARIKNISIRLTVVSFFEEHKNIVGTEPEWPVWCGMLRFQFAEYDSPRGARIEEARVVVSTPFWRHNFIRSWKRYMDEQQQVIFSPEPRRFVPVLPLGRVVGLSRTDSITLSLIARQLEENNEVGLPPTTLTMRNYHSEDFSIINEIRIISPRQAQERIDEFPLYRAGRELLALIDSQDPQSDETLLAFWNDDHNVFPLESVAEDMIGLINTKSKSELTDHISGSRVLRTRHVFF